MKKRDRKPVLEDHKREKKRLIPPLLAAMRGGFEPYSWARELVPEFLWIALLHGGMGLRNGTNFALKLALAANEICGKEPPPLFAKTTAYDCLTGSEKQGLYDKLAEQEDFSEAQKALRPIFDIFSQSPIHFLSKGYDFKINENDSSMLEELLPNLYDRYSRESALVMATAAYIGLKQGKIIISSHSTPHIAKILSDDFTAIEAYPDTPDSEKAAAAFRAMAPMFRLNHDDDTQSSHEAWLEKFWEQIAGSGECLLELDTDFAESEPSDPLGRIIVRYRNASRCELRTRLDKWGFDLNSIEKYEVIGALLARQTTLAVDLSSSPPIWTPHSAPLFLRAMADVFITLSWIFNDPQIRAKKFVDDGLGQIKLELEHRKRELADSQDTDPKNEEIIKYWELWMSSQRMNDFIEVNLGNWSGLNTRKMAEEAGCLDFYNYVYQPFSAAIHSTWPHVSDKNTQYCLNPAHRYHRVPLSVDLEPDTFWPLLGAKYLEKTLKKFDEETGVTIDIPSAYTQLGDDFEDAGIFGEK